MLQYGGQRATLNNGLVGRRRSSTIRTAVFNTPNCGVDETERVTIFERLYPDQSSLCQWLILILDGKEPRSLLRD